MSYVIKDEKKRKYRVSDLENQGIDTAELYKRQKNFSSFFGESYNFLTEEGNRYNSSDYDTLNADVDLFRGSSDAWREKAKQARSYLDDR